MSTSSPTSEFGFWVDSKPAAWQFLASLQSEDLITELIQNELDAGSTATKITFDETKLSCEGNGKPVDHDGWDRLRSFYGAGGDFPRKHNSFGVKNHGLKTCFAVGNDIFIRSDGRCTQQTLFAQGRDEAPDPGALRTPLHDDSAPHTGCRIEVPYRSQDFHVPVGETLPFSAPSSSDIANLFQRACEELPTRFLGVMRPDVRSKYAISLIHHELGTAEFVFRCRRSKNSRIGVLFSRSCEVFGSAVEKKTIRERGILRRVKWKKELVHEVPQFFVSRGGFVLDVAWEVDSHSQPKTTAGRYRYPIAYPGSGSEAMTGLSVYFSGPFTSDSERHGMSGQSKHFHDWLINECDNSLTLVLQKHLLPKHGPRSLELILDAKRVATESTKRVLWQLLTKGSIPVVDSRTIHSKRTTSRRVRFSGFSSEEDPWSFVIPCLNSSRNAISHELAAVCPAECSQLAPGTPAPLISLLADAVYENGQEAPFTDANNYCTFDEDDLFNLVNRKAGVFPVPQGGEWEGEFITPSNASRYLDALEAIEKAEAITENTRKELKDSLRLPTADGTLVAVGNLYFASGIPPDIPGSEEPDIIHPELREHPLFRRRAWRLPKFDFERFLETIELDNAADETRRAFWKWFLQNQKLIPRKCRQRLAILPIWPTQDDKFIRFEELCWPRHSSVRRILEADLDLPSSELRGVRIVRHGGRSILSIRMEPSAAEIECWFRRRLADFPKQKKLSSAQKRRFSKFEDDLAELVKDSHVARCLRQLRNQAFALDKTGRLKPYHSLHRETDEVRQAGLLPEDLINRRRKEIDKVFPPRSFISAAAVLRAFEQSSAERGNQWLKRLRAFFEAIQREPIEHNKLQSIRFIPVGHSLYAPEQLCLKGRKGDFWGDWKVGLSAGQMSPAEQDLLRRAGVTSSVPEQRSSQAFFRWLSHQLEATIRSHLKSVLRHFHHENGPLRWWKQHPTVPCLPVRNRSNVRLVPYRDIIQPGNRIFLDDFPELGRTILSQNSGVWLAVAEIEKLRLTIREDLQEVGIASLRKAAGKPTRVIGNDVTDVTHSFEPVLRLLRSSEFAGKVFKRLSHLGVSTSLLQPDWRSRVNDVKTVQECATVTSQYSLDRDRFTLNVDAEFDESTGRLFVKRVTHGGESAVYFALGRLIFKNDAPPYTSLTLRAMVEDVYVEPDELSIDSNLAAGDEDVDSVCSDTEFDSERLENETAEARRAHFERKPDWRKNIPHPQSLDSEVAASHKIDAKQTRQRGERRSRSSTSDAESPLIEQRHKQQLKETYAWHCQVCLANHQPAELAPRGSYVEMQENRSRLIDAHHVDLKHASGARHGGNLMVLCKLHHDQLGDMMSRIRVTEALRNCKTRYSVEYKDSSRNESLDGVLIEIPVPISNKPIRCFFSDYHREFWLQHASADN